MWEQCFFLGLSTTNPPKDSSGSRLDLVVGNCRRFQVESCKLSGWDSINFHFQGAMSVISVAEAGLFAREPIYKGGSIWDDRNVMR